jgi:hypothetical protein
MKSGSKFEFGANAASWMFSNDSSLFYTALFLCSLILIPLSTRPRFKLEPKPKLPPPLKQDESCLACHGQAGMTSDKGKSISIDPGKHAASVHGTLGCTDCHRPSRTIRIRQSSEGSMLDLPR